MIIKGDLWAERTTQKTFRDSKREREREIEGKKRRERQSEDEKGEEKRRRGISSVIAIRLIQWRVDHRSSIDTTDRERAGRRASYLYALRASQPFPKPFVRAFRNVGAISERRTRKTLVKPSPHSVDASATVIIIRFTLYSQRMNQLRKSCWEIFI